LYHDLNPRMNGVIDSMARLLDRPGRVPLIAAVLSRHCWNADELLLLEADLHAATARLPQARVWLTATVERPRIVSTVPPAGRWRIDLEGRRVEHVDVGSLGDDSAPDMAELQPMIPPGSRLIAGDRLALGNLYCSPELADAISDMTDPFLIDAFLA
jgi:hypothetical protein